jgi:hypothetical protein
MSKSRAIPLLGKAGKFPTFVVFGASSVSTGMKAQTSNRSAMPIYPENWNFPATPPHFQRSLLLDHASDECV